MRIDSCMVETWPGAPPCRGWLLDSGEVQVIVSELGAHLHSVRVPGSTPLGQPVELLVGYPSDAQGPVGSHGATVGRYANRIAGAAFELDGVVHSLDPNDGPNTLHGGRGSFSERRWTSDAEINGTRGEVALGLHSPAGDLGFPGSVDAIATFSLEGRRLSVLYEAFVGAPTPLNLTCHAYWNLAGGGPLDGHRLEIDAGSFVQVDDELLPVPGPPASVVDSRWDCRSGRRLGDGVFDHCWVLDAPGDDRSPQLRLRHQSGRSLSVTTNQLGVQVYTGNHLPPSQGAVALETQCLPNTPNRPDFGSCIVRPGDQYRSVTHFDLDWR